MLYNGGVHQYSIKTLSPSPSPVELEILQFHIDPTPNHPPITKSAHRKALNFLNDKMKG